MLKTIGLLTKHSPNAHSTSLFVFLQQKQQCRPQTLLSNSRSYFPSVELGFCVIQEIYKQVPVSFLNSPGLIWQRL